MTEYELQGAADGARFAQEHPTATNREIHHASVVAADALDIHHDPRYEYQEAFVKAVQEAMASNNRP